MATQQGWDDFCRLKSQWQGVILMVSSLKNEIDELSAIKTEVIVDGDRKAAMTPVGNQYPNYNMNSICTDVDRMIALKAILTANGY